MKTYLVKKDINKPNSEDNWIIMTGYEFARFIETEDGQRRKKNFARLEPCSEHDDIIILECGEEKAKAWKNERLRSLYRVCAKAKHPLLSYDGIMPGKHVYCGIRQKEKVQQTRMGYWTFGGSGGIRTHEPLRAT